MGRLGLDLGGFTGNVLKAEGMTRVLGGTFSTFLANPLLGIVDLAKRAGGALVHMITGPAQEADSLRKLAMSTGTTIEFLSGLRHAADLSNTSIDAMEGAFTRMVRGMQEEGGAAAFEALGIQVRDSSGQLRSAQNVFLEVADAFSQMENQTERAGKAQDIFGRTAQELIPLLSEGKAGISAMIAEAGELGLVFDDTSGAGAERFNDALTRMSAVWAGLKQNVAVPLFEALAPVLEALIPPLKIVSELVGGILKVVTAPIAAIAGLFTPGGGGAARGGAGGAVNVNVTVDPESTAEGVARRVAPAIARATRGITSDLQTSARRTMDLHDWQAAAAMRTV